MARGSAQKDYRASCARISLEIPKEMKAEWDAYAASQGLPTGRMIRNIIEREIAQSGWKAGETAPVAPKAEAPAPKPAPVKKVRTSWGGISCMEED